MYIFPVASLFSPPSRFWTTTDKKEVKEKGFFFCRLPFFFFRGLRVALVAVSRPGERGERIANSVLADANILTKIIGNNWSILSQHCWGKAGPNSYSFVRVHGAWETDTSTSTNQLGNSLRPLLHPSYFLLAPKRGRGLLAPRTYCYNSPIVLVRTHLNPTDGPRPNFFFHGRIWAGHLYCGGRKEKESFSSAHLYAGRRRRRRRRRKSPCEEWVSCSYTRKRERDNIVAGIGLDCAVLFGVP